MEQQDVYITCGKRQIAWVTFAKGQLMPGWAVKLIDWMVYVAWTSWQWLLWMHSLCSACFSVFFPSLVSLLRTVVLFGHNVNGGKLGVYLILVTRYSNREGIFGLTTQNVLGLYGDVW